MAKLLRRREREVSERVSEREGERGCVSKTREREKEGEGEGEGALPVGGLVVDVVVQCSEDEAHDDAATDLGEQTNGIPELDEKRP